MFGQLFPSLPQFRGRQVVTLHNQRDFLFFRRHRYAFASPTEAKLQEIGPRFTLKLRWMRKGLPGVKAADGRMAAGGDKSGDTEFAVDDSDDEDVAQQEKDDEAEAAAAMARGEITPAGQAIPALDEEQEYEWKWKVRLAHHHAPGTAIADICSPRWRCPAEPSSCRLSSYISCSLTILYYCIVASSTRTSTMHRFSVLDSAC